MVQELNRRQFVAGTVAAAAGLCAPTIIKAAANSGCELIGRFEYEGDAPERKKLTVDKDIDCCGKFDIRDESLMVGEDRGLMNVYVYVRSRGVEVLPEVAERVEDKVTLDNLDCIFQPHCMSLWAEKQEFYIVNSDPVAQNVAFSPLGDLPANIVMPVGADATWTFRRSQTLPVPIACNYHPWESAYILPRDNPYVAISAADGTFRISNLPPGELEFQAWQERLDYLDIPQWPKGRFTVALEPGVKDLGTIKLNPSLFDKP
jgi:hypothetical protein